jgi:hypothetical protein
MRASPAEMAGCALRTVVRAAVEARAVDLRSVSDIRTPLASTREAPAQLAPAREASAALARAREAFHQGAEASRPTTAQ